MYTQNQGKHRKKYSVIKHTQEKVKYKRIMKLYARILQYYPLKKTKPHLI